MSNRLAAAAATKIRSALSMEVPFTTRENDTPGCCDCLQISCEDFLTKILGQSSWPLFLANLLGE
jgi:hypothetical protein